MARYVTDRRRHDNTVTAIAANATEREREREREMRGLRRLPIDKDVTISVIHA